MMLVEHLVSAYMGQATHDAIPGHHRDRAARGPRTPGLGSTAGAAEQAGHCRLALGPGRAALICFIRLFAMTEPWAATRRLSARPPTY